MWWHYDYQRTVMSIVNLMFSLKRLCHEYSRSLSIETFCDMKCQKWKISGSM